MHSRLYQVFSRIKKDDGLYILKELKYATHKNSTVDVVIKSLLGSSCRLLTACDEIGKSHFIDKIDAKTSKTTNEANYDVNVGKKVKMPNIVHVW